MPIPVFYNPAQSATSDCGYSPSAAKPRLVVEDWLAQGLDIEVIAGEAATRATLCRAHDADYVDGVLDCRRANGFGGREPDVAASLPYTTGSLLAAAKHVVQGLAPVACSPTSGFHHAHYEDGGAFCTFNGLVVTALELQALGLVDKVGILDMDQHYGDGTDDIIFRLDLTWIRHVSTGADRESRKRMIDRGRETVIDKFSGVDLLIYQAGADSHVDDPLGGYLNTEQMRQRDADVFAACEQAGIPLVWNLAGGYQRDAGGGIAPVLALHRNTMVECIRAYAQLDQQDANLLCSRRQHASAESAQVLLNRV